MDVQHELALGTLRITFQRSVKLDASAPAGRLQSYGRLPIAAMSDTLSYVPVREEEAVWLGLETSGGAAALRVVVEGMAMVDAITGAAARSDFITEPQNYVVVPSQQWLDGMMVGPSCAKQFVRVATSDIHVQVRSFHFTTAFLARADAHEQVRTPHPEAGAMCDRPGHAQQRIERDPYGVAAWAARTLRHAVQLVSVEEFESLAGQPGPAPLDRRAAYGGWRLP